MTKYRVKRVNLNTGNYWKAVENAPIEYCDGIRKLRFLIGGGLHRMNNLSGNRCVYHGIINNIEYFAERI